MWKIKWGVHILIPIVNTLNIDNNNQKLKDVSIRLRVLEIQQLGNLFGIVYSFKEPFYNSYF